MHKVLAVLFASRGQLHPASAELMGCAKSAASELAGQLDALAVGDVDEAAADVLASLLWSWGAGRVGVLSHPALAAGDPEAYVSALAQAVQALDPSVVVMNGDMLGGQIGPRLAMRVEAASVTEVVGMRPEPGGVGWVRPVYGGKAQAVVRSRRQRTVVTVRPRSFAAPEARSGQPPEGARFRAGVTVTVDPARSVRVVERRQPETQGVRLEEARVIVSGGRGVGGAGNFRRLEELAQLLGGAVGASRAAVDAGWVPASQQIGQTGKIVAPELYIAVGISGASQHLAGIAGSRHVVAINKDPQAPIFRVAEVGAVEDFRAILPPLIDRLKSVLSGGRR